MPSPFFMCVNTLIFIVTKIIITLIIVDTISKLDNYNVSRCRTTDNDACSFEMHFYPCSNQ